MNISVYPNPASDEIRFNTSEEVMSATMQDNAGKVIKRFDTVNNEEGVNVMDVPAGVYFISATLASGEQASSKVIIIR